eukprot:12824568-Alexandrium_andersonii.AAC.1
MSRAVGAAEEVMRHSARCPCVSSVAGGSGGQCTQGPAANDWSWQNYSKWVRFKSMLANVDRGIRL